MAMNPYTIGLVFVQIDEHELLLVMLDQTKVGCHMLLVDRRQNATNFPSHFTRRRVLSRLTYNLSDVLSECSLGFLRHDGL